MVVARDEDGIWHDVRGELHEPGDRAHGRTRKKVVGACGAEFRASALSSVETAEAIARHCAVCRGFKPAA